MYEIQRFEKLERKKPSRLKNIFRVIIFVLLVSFTLNVLVNSYLGKSSKNANLFLSPLSAVEKVIQKTSSIIMSQENSKNLDAIVGNILKEDISNYSVYINNLKTGERYYLNQDKQFDTASLYKLWVMATAYAQIENGTLKKEEVLSADVSDINNKFNIASESAELTEGTVSWSVENALKNMITISDNYSALLLSSRVRLSNVSQFLKNNNLLESRVGTSNTNPISTAKDIGLFFEKLYNREFGNENNTNEMLNLLKNQQINTKLSKNLPDSVIIGHKTGELDYFSHDGGIVFSEKGDYVIVIMSKTNIPVDANENIAQISKQVYEYFSK